MPSPSQLLLFELDYSEWADCRLLEACAGLTPEQLNCEIGGAWGSVLGTLRHIAESERGWYDMLLALAMPNLADLGPTNLAGDDQPTLEDLSRTWPEVWTTLRDWLTVSPRRPRPVPLLPRTGRQADRHPALADGSPRRQSLHTSPRPDHEHAPRLRRRGAEHRRLHLCFLIARTALAALRGMSSRVSPANIPVLSGAVSPSHPVVPKTHARTRLT